MKKLIDLLEKNPQVSDYKINVRSKESCELFYVKGKLETVRRTETCDKEVTVYSDHGEYKGDAQFYIYPSTTVEDMEKKIDEAVKKALLINNRSYDLPSDEQGDYEVESNFREYELLELTSLVSGAVFDANKIENAALNSVEIFINKVNEEIINSRNLHKTQVKYDAMVEAIPTYNGENQSVELYEQYNFSSFDAETVKNEIISKLEEVRARYNAVKPEKEINCKVIIKDLEVYMLFAEMAYDLNYSSVYSKSNLFSKGDFIQKSDDCDRIGITMAGEIEGSVRSSKFDTDGMTLGEIRLVDGGKAVNYYGSNRYGQYLGEKPTGILPCICVDAGTVKDSDISGEYLEIISMSGLQVDFYNDYIGGEIRLAYYNDGEKIIPVTGISVSGKLTEVLDSIRLSSEITVYSGYRGPQKAVLSKMKIF